MENEARIILTFLAAGGLLTGCKVNSVEAAEEIQGQIETTAIDIVSVTGETITVEPLATATMEPTFTQTVTPTPTEIATATPTNEPTKEILTQEKIDFLASHEINIGDTSRNIIMMTYDDGGSAEKVERVMSTAESYGGKVTFFMPGNWVTKNPDLAREIVARGHLLESHGWDHAEMTALSDEQVRQQMGDFLDIMKEVVPDYEVKFIRFPYGSTDDRVIRIAAELGMQSVLWGFGSGGEDEGTFQRVIDNAYKGAVVLSHSTRYYDVMQAENIFANLASQGYEFVTVEDGRDPSDVWGGN